ncbi:hypothetical protein EYC80_005110 [Monilinia laxa]|uniref:Uncharacterized protein n=1 Tax=Monilinia laxa TaxID=61186 RepID=A0A5N6KJ69_MONLA|nr:hypothetical protein EYC80_005110 [Monilinia laxa]
MVVLPSNGQFHPHGIKREHDQDHVYDVRSLSANSNTPGQHQHQKKKKKKKKDHHQQIQNGYSNGEDPKKKKSQKSKYSSEQSQSQSRQDTLMSGGLGEMSAELGEPILPPARNSQHPISTVPAMKEKYGGANVKGSVGNEKNKKSKNIKTVHFERFTNDHAPDGEEGMETETVQTNGNARHFQTTILPVRSQNPILPPTSSPILPPSKRKQTSTTRSRSYSSHASENHNPTSPNRMDLFSEPPASSQTPILPPVSPFRKRRGSTGGVFNGPLPSFSAAESSLEITRPISVAKPVENKSKDDAWEFTTGKIRASIVNPMEKDAQREESE